MPFVLDSADLSGNECNHVLECLRAGAIGNSGEFRGRFESSLAALIDVPHVFAINHGAVALQAALAALDLGPKDEVIVSALAGTDAANAVRLAGGVPVFADIDSRTGCLRFESASRLIGSRTRALVASQRHGAQCDLDALRELTTRYGVWLIEDVGGAIGTTNRSRQAGSIGDLAVFDFSCGGVVTTGQGGAIATRQPVLAERVRRVVDADVTSRPGCATPGYDCRLSNLAAAIGSAQLERLQELLARCRRVSNWYSTRLQLLPQLVPCPESVASTYEVLCPDKTTRDNLVELLLARGVEAAQFTMVLHHTAAYRTCRHDGGCPVACDWSYRGMRLPAPAHAQEDDVESIIAHVRAALEALPGKLMLRRVAA